MLTPFIDALNQTLQTKFHSLARYALESEPYHVPEQVELMKALKSVAASDEALAKECVRRIEAMEGIPVTGTPDAIVTEIAYLDVKRLVEICLERKETEARDAEVRFEAIQKAGAVTPEAVEATAFLEQVAESDRLQAESLREALRGAN